jgi:murein DD-endopeptidase MepM/ murein hydrolase activator NlpD
MKFVWLKNSILAFITFFVCIIGFHGNLYAQYVGDDTIYVFESLNDSIDLASNKFDVTDSAGFYFFNYTADSSEVAAFPVNLAIKNLEDWNNEVLFFNRSFDPTKIQDSILVVFQDSVHKFFPPRLGVITSKFGWRKRQFHYGTDINLETGDTVRSAFDGIVRIAKMGWGGGYGNVIIIRHPNGFETLYGHLSAVKVLPNQEVKAGDIIGLGGNTGHSFGSHLHFEMRYHGIAMNPETFIDFSIFKIKNDSVYLSKKSFGYVSEIKKIAGSMKYYKVKSGDSLSKVAAKNGTSLSAICKLNGIKSTKILQVGQVLRVR